MNPLANHEIRTLFTVQQSTLRQIYDWAKQIQVLPVSYTGDDLAMAKEAVAQARRCAAQIIDLIPINAIPR